MGKRERKVKIEKGKEGGREKLRDRGGKREKKDLERGRETKGERGERQQEKGDNG